MLANCKTDELVSTDTGDPEQAHGDERGNGAAGQAVAEGGKDQAAEASTPGEAASEQPTLGWDATRQEAALAVPQRVGPYRLEQQIGRGGMGAVYLASRVDGEFQQRVAVKLIRHGWESEFAIRRFRNERQILATLDHPYIARLLDGGTTDRGLPYFVMEYVEGRQLLTFCEEENLSNRERIDLFVRICAAVGYAHERQIIHRDLKPGNILVRRDGTPKLLDFGIAKIMGADAAAPTETVTGDPTQAGLRLLTPAYASPEQARGDEATELSDVYSLGVILYELLWGERPSLATLGSEAESGVSWGETGPPTLEAIVRRAIRMDPEERYSKAGELARYLQDYLDGVETTRMPGRREAASIAVLPFRYKSPEVAEHRYLAAGIADALTAKLSAIERLSVRPTAATMRYGAEVDWKRAAREMKVQYLVDGSVQVQGGSVRARLQLIVAESNTIVWASHFQEPTAALVQLEELLAEQVAQALLPYLSGQERAQLGERARVHPQAHQAYLRGRWHWSRSSGQRQELDKAFECFQEAIALDPTYARPHAGLADYHIRQALWEGNKPAESFSAAKAAALEAIALDPLLAEGHACLALACWAHEGDVGTAEQHLELAISRNPNHSAALHWYGLLHLARKRFDVAVANLERARQIDPRSAVIVSALGFAHYCAGRANEAIALLEDGARELRNSAMISETLAWCYLRSGKAEVALACAMEAAEKSGRSPASLACLATVYGRLRRSDSAEAIAAELERASQSSYVSKYEMATAYWGAGIKKRALACLDVASDVGEWGATWLNVDPRWESLKTERQFQRILRRLNSRGGKAGGRRSFTVLLPEVGLAIALAGCLLVWAYQWFAREGHFADVKLTRITGNGLARQAAISPDGSKALYAVVAHGETDLILSDLKTGQNSSLESHLRGNVAALQFTESGRAFSYVRYGWDRPAQRAVYIREFAGKRGTSEKIFESFFAGGAVSPDGNQVAYYERIGPRDELWVYNRKSGDRKLLKSYHYPERLAAVAAPAWSPDGSRIAYALEYSSEDGFHVGISLIDRRSGAIQALRSRDWNWVEQVSWAGSANALAVVGQERDSPFKQIWYTPISGGKASRIGNNLENYGGVSVAADGSRMVAIQLKTDSNIFVADSPAEQGDTTRIRQLTQGSGRYFDVCWTPSGRIVYASDGTGAADLWTVDPEDGEAHVLTGNAGRNYAPTVSPDGRTLAFHSNRSGGWQIWAAGEDGSTPRQLSNSSRDGNWPQFSPDGRWLIYHQTDWNGSYNLWRVPAAGGQPQRLTTEVAMHPAISPRDGSIAAWWSADAEHPHWRLAIFEPTGGRPKAIFTPTAQAYPDTALRWTRTGSGLTYLDHSGGAANIWLQPLDGAAPRRLTNFTSGEIYSFDWDKHGRLLYSRGLTTWDVVLIQDTRADRRLISLNVNQRE